MGVLRERMIEEMKLRTSLQQRRILRLRGSRLAKYHTNHRSAEQGGHPSFSGASDGGTEVVA